ncbi:flavodoxin family protein [Streptomyces sp. ISL-100]|uniref:flavodoxin family protein n=1 Tax=Streptomyces sp. ISL-100 TaxID=2819173 RepID=UPI001BE8FFBC|nr:flavodoxin family protein [Streptomyces sp. ISL-100]MBT2398038.1 flavodoxin family protein [Streptomyces sp. ISL-100]
MTTPAVPPVVSIAYHSGYGHTAVVAEAVRAGAADAGATVHVIKVDEISDEQWELLDASDAIVFGSPTYMGTASGAFHQFAEDSSKRWFTDTWHNKLAAGFTNSASKSGDKLHTLQFFQTLAAQHAMHWVSLGLKPGWNSTEGSENDLNRLGFFSGAGAQTNSDEGPDGVHKADIATAEHLGRRIAETAKVFAAGREAVAA